MNIEEVREALIEWETLSANKENRVLYEAKAKELRDLLSNLEGKRREGIQKGIQKEKREIALKMLAEGMDISIILKYTELNEEEIDELRKMNN